MPSKVTNPSLLFSIRNPKSPTTFPLVFLCIPPGCGSLYGLARIFHELLSRDHEAGRATGQSKGAGSEAYLDGTSQGPTPEDARKDGHIRRRSHAKA